MIELTVEQYLDRLDYDEPNPYERTKVNYTRVVKAKPIDYDAVAKMMVKRLHTFISYEEMFNILHIPECKDERIIMFSNICKINKMIAYKNIKLKAVERVGYIVENIDFY